MGFKSWTSPILYFPLDHPNVLIRNIFFGWDPPSLLHGNLNFIPISKLKNLYFLVSDITCRAKTFPHILSFVYLFYLHNCLNTFISSCLSICPPLSVPFFYILLSVTRRLDHLFNIWLFTPMKICPIAFRICQNKLKILANTK